MFSALEAVHAALQLTEGDVFACTVGQKPSKVGGGLGGVVGAGIARWRRAPLSPKPPPPRAAVAHPRAPLPTTTTMQAPFYVNDPADVVSTLGRLTEPPPPPPPPRASPSVSFA